MCDCLTRRHLADNLRLISTLTTCQACVCICLLLFFGDSASVTGVTDLSGVGETDLARADVDTPVLQALAMRREALVDIRPAHGALAEYSQ